MRVDDQDVLRQMDVEAEDDCSAAIAQRLLQALMMQSQDIDDDDAAVSGEDDAPVAADVELDLTGGMQPPARLEVPEFYTTHKIDMDSLPTPDGPVHDPGVSFESLLKDLTPVGVEELALIGATSSPEPGNDSKIIGVKTLLFIGRLIHSGEPLVYPNGVGVRLRLEDVTGEDLTVVVHEGSMDCKDPHKFAEYIALRYPKGTAIAMRDFVLKVFNDSFVMILEKAVDGAAIWCLGDSQLPPVDIYQIALQCALLVKADRYDKVVGKSVVGIRAAQDAISGSLVPLLTNLALAQLRLGEEALALAYAAALGQVLFQRWPAKSCVVAAHVLRRMGHNTAAVAATIMGHFESGDPLEWIETLGSEVFKVHAHLDSLNIEDRALNFFKEGSRGMAEALVNTQRLWTEHALGNADAVKAMADKARIRHGAQASQMLKDEASTLFLAGSCPGKALKNKQKVEQAVLRWRAALWLHVDKSYDRAGYSTWDILDSRYMHWAKANIDGADPDALHYLDLVALTMMRGSHVETTALRRNVVRGKCRLGRGEEEFQDALQESIQDMEIEC